MQRGASLSPSAPPPSVLIVDFIDRGPGGNLQSFYGEAPPRGLISYPVIYHFNRKGTPFTYLVQNFASFFNCCKFTFF